MWMMPKITDIFILKEFRKVRRFVAKFQIWRQNRQTKEAVTAFPCPRPGSRGAGEGVGGGGRAPG